MGSKSWLNTLIWRIDESVLIGDEWINSKLAPFAVDQPIGSVIRSQLRVRQLWLPHLRSYILSARRVINSERGQLIGLERNAATVTVMLAGSTKRRSPLGVPR